ncbi:MAG: hypothetical protein LBM96_00625 [Methanobrevibacter sp.]|jgi:hypothetical protein|nr:hypothetical protein [Candidatus Methanoflexus mossambicus]
MSYIKVFFETVLLLFMTSIICILQFLPAIFIAIISVHYGFVECYSIGFWIIVFIVLVFTVMIYNIIRNPL